MLRSLLPFALCLVSLVTPLWAEKVAERSDAELKNSGFESGGSDWSIHVYGARPTIEPDENIVHEGKRSIRISSTELSDTAIAQDVVLRPRHWYRFSGWVKTKSLDPKGSPVCGTFQIQMPDGRGLIAAGPNHKGDTDWTEIRLEFEAPLDGRVHITPFFVGFGKGTGTAWFDDLKLEQMETSHETIKIRRDRLPGKISALQYGQFVEYLCDLIPSMWAEKLYDGSFEGLTTYKFPYLKETDFKEKPWYPYGATNRADFAVDREQSVSGQTSQRISVKEHVPCTVGIAQDGIAVSSKIPCEFRTYFRQEGITGPIQVRLMHEDRELAACTFEAGRDWKKFQSRMTAMKTETTATLSITFSGPGTLWIDNASLMPDSNMNGWRRDVVEATKALKPGIIRFGGSALDDANLGEFEWKDTIGDPDRRQPFRAWGGLQPTGPGLEEIVQFCHLVDAEPLICVRVSKRGPESAFEQVQYFNGTTETPMGQWRAKNGHAEPYRIKYWQVGNERAGADYENALAPYCKAMREADPSIVILSSYPSPGVLEKAGDLIQYVCPHHYDCGNLAATEHDLNATREMLTRHAHGKSIKVAVTEWNTTAGHWGPQRAMLWTLENALACSRYHNLIHRNADLVEIANRSNLTNSFCSGILQTDRSRLYKTPTYYAQELYATKAGTQPLKLDTKTSRPLDLSATLSDDGKVVTLFAINPTLDHLVRPLDFSEFGDQAADLAIWTLEDQKHTGEPDVTNSFGEPTRISPITSTLKTATGKFKYTFPPLSLTVIQRPAEH